MPAWRLDGQDRQVNHFDVGAVDGTRQGFISHVLLCLAEQPQVVNVNSRTPDAVHMGPPLEERPQPIDAIGTAVLDPGGVQPTERRQIKVFVDDRLSERKAQEARMAKLNRRDPYHAEYVIHPPYVEPGEDVSLWRFSCAGFVLRAYEEANIHLIDVSKVPPIDLDRLKAAYPRFARLLGHAATRTSLGLGEGSEWPVVLAGYVVNSLNRSPDAIRREAFVPDAGDEFFPPRPLSPKA